jgi:hypothetical protein
MNEETANELKVLGDVRRVSLLRVFASGAASARGAGMRANVPSPNPAYNVRALERAGFIYLQEETTINYGAAKLYAITEKGQRGLALVMQWERERALP